MSVTRECTWPLYFEQAAGLFSNEILDYDYEANRRFPVSQRV